MGNKPSTSVSNILANLLDRPIAFHRPFVDITGSVLSALMLSQAVYWSKRTTDPNGWFYKTQAEWQEETGLDRPEQESSRAKLRSTLFWQEKRSGVPAKMYYRVDLEELHKALLGQYDLLTIEQILEKQSILLGKHSRMGYARAQKLGVQAHLISYVDVLQAKGMICGICGDQILRGIGQQPDQLTFDYIVPLGLGGSHTFDNLQPAHVCCVESKGCTNLQIPTDESVKNQQSQSVKNQQTRALTDNDLAGCELTCKPVVDQQAIYTETTTETTTEITSKNNRESDPPQKNSDPQPAQPKQPTQQPFTMPGFGQTIQEWGKYGSGHDKRVRAAQAQGMEVDPKLLREITDVIAEAYGLTYAINEMEDDRELKRMQEIALNLCKGGFNTVEKVTALIQTIKDDKGYEILMGNVLVQYASQSKKLADQRGSNNGSAKNKKLGSTRKDSKGQTLAERAAQYAEYDSIGKDDWVPEPEV